jgi:methylisocitrate lyase
VVGLDEAIHRAQEYVKAGANAIFVETPMSVDEYKLIAQSLPAVDLVADVTEGGKSPMLSADELYAIGFKIVLFSASAIRAVMKTLQTFYSQLHKERSSRRLLDQIIGFEERNRLLRLADAARF